MPAKCTECSPEHLCLRWCWVAVGTSCSPLLVLVWALHKTFAEVALPVINPSSIHLLLFQHQPVKPVWKYWVLGNHLLLGRCVFAIGTSLLETLICGVLLVCLGFSVTQMLGALQNAKFVCFALSAPLFWNAVWVYVCF